VVRGARARQPVRRPDGGTLENKSAGAVFSSVAIYVGVAGLVAVAGAPFVKRVMGKIE
jgi:hypothetical protein